MSDVTKILLSLGVLLILGALIYEYGGRYLPLGKLPGDIAVTRGNARFYFPLATSLLVSVALSAILWILRKF